MFLFLVIIGLPGMAYLVFQLPAVQNSLVVPLSNLLTENLGSEVTFRSLHFRFFNRIVIDDLYAEDENGDTLIFAGKVTGTLKRFSSADRILDLQKITFNKCTIRLATDSAGTLNLAFLTSRLKRKDSTATRMAINIGGIDINDGTFIFESWHRKQRESGINFSDARLNDLYLEIDDLGKQRNDTVGFTISKLEFTEQSGFRVDKMKTWIEIHRKFIVLKNVELYTPESTFRADALGLSFSSYKDFRQFAEKVAIDFMIAPSEISTVDLSFFTPVFSNIKENLLITGHIYGGIDDLKGKEIQLSYGEKTGLMGDFNFIGLPDIKETYLYLDVRNFTVGLDEIASVSWPMPVGRIVIPENLTKLGVITFKGNFTGFIDDFVTYGRFTTEMGSILSDLSIRPDTANTFAFNGNIQTNDFQLGFLTGMENLLGDVSMNLQISGFSKQWKSFNGTMEGVIESILLNGYNYENIEIDGTLHEKAFDGSVSVEDPNIKMNFLGLVDFSTEVPEFDFTANILRANLNALNLYRKDTTLSVNMLVTANFTGNTIDNIQGTIKVLNSTFTRQGKELNLYNASLLSTRSNDVNALSLRTDFVDADLKGQFEARHLGPAFRYVLSAYLPSLNDTICDPELLASNQFEYAVKFKSVEPLLRFISDDYHLSSGSTLSGIFNPTARDFRLRFEGNMAGYKSIQLNNFSIISGTGDKVYQLEADAKSLNLNPDIELKGLQLNTIATSDSIALRLNWDDKAREVSRGILNGSCKFSKKEQTNNPTALITFHPSEVVVRDTLWNIHTGHIFVDSSSVMVDNILIDHKGQSLSVRGGVSKSQADTLMMRFHRLDLAWLNQLTRSEKLNVEGILSGEARVTGLYETPAFFSNMMINGFTLNREILGNTQITSWWENESRSVNLNVIAVNENRETFLVDGNYCPPDGSLDFNLSLKEVDIAVIEPVLNKVFSSMEGKVNGKLTLKGSFDEPLLNGTLDFDNTSFMINYLKTVYRFSQSMNIRNNNLYFDRVEVFDSGKNKAILWGKIETNNFKNIFLDLSVDAKNFHCLNTNAGDNDRFYGTAYGTGIIRLTGPPGEMKINVSARTEQGTRIFISLDSDEEVSELAYIRFINVPADVIQDVIKSEYQVRIQGLLLDFDLEITPDAEAQIIFDSETGDVLSGKGQGNLKMEINTLGTFRMMGEYEIEQGDYMFTLQNVQVKKFDVEQGGKILFNGDPLNATIDMQALYKTRASLSELAMDQNYARRIPVNCKILLTGKLMSPEIQFDIELPTVDEETRMYLRNFVNTQQKLLNQFLSLLILDNFLPDASVVTQASQGTSGGTVGVASVGATTSKILSTQLGNWISQINEDFDIGFNYIPGDEITPNQVEVALSTQLLNDRVTINGYVDMGTSQAETKASDIQGEFDMDIKLNRSGKLRLKAFNRANDKFISNQAPYTQGVGLFYREEFDSFGELLRQYWNRLFETKENTE